MRGNPVAIEDLLNNGDYDWKLLENRTLASPSSSNQEKYDIALSFAVKHGNFIVAQKLLEAGAKPVANLRFEYTVGEDTHLFIGGPLAIATHYKNPKMQNLLITHGANLCDILWWGATTDIHGYHADPYRDSIINFGVKKPEDFWLISEALRLGLVGNKTAVNWPPILVKVFEAKDYDLAKDLLIAGVQCPESIREKFLDYAQQCNDAQLLACLGVDRIQLDYRMREKIDARLVQAVKQGDVREAKNLIQRGGNVDHFKRNIDTRARSEYSDENRLLHFAVKNGDLKMISLLKKHHADDEALNYDGESARSIAKGSSLWVLNFPNFIDEAVKYILDCKAGDDIVTYITSTVEATTLDDAHKNTLRKLAKNALLHIALQGEPLSVNCQNFLKDSRAISIGRLFQKPSSSFEIYQLIGVDKNKAREQLAAAIEKNHRAVANISDYADSKQHPFFSPLMSQPKEISLLVSSRSSQP